MAPAIEEIAIYIHRFHNLDLLSQGWYQIKMTARWEGSESVASFGVPSRVLQYEVPDSLSNDTGLIWEINDEDHSFHTHPFVIKYKRQDVYLSMVVSFTLNVTSLELLFTKGVMLRFELLHVPSNGIFFDIPDSVDFTSASVHEFLIPPKALFGLHSYCPVQFDTLHTCLVELSVHVILQRGSMKFPARDNHLNESKDGQTTGAKEVDESGYDDNDIALLKALCASQNNLIDSLKNILESMNAKNDDIEVPEKINIQHLMRKISKRFQSHLTGSSENNIAEEHDSNSMKLGNLSMSYFQQDDELVGDSEQSLWTKLLKSDFDEAFQFLGNQISLLWSSFLNYHRMHKVEILDQLRQQWAETRSVEWSLWLVYPPELKNSNLSNEDSGSITASYVELHRKSISQMLINNCCLQDMHIFGSPSQNPIIFVEHTQIPCKNRSSEVDGFLRENKSINDSKGATSDSMTPSIPSKISDPVLCKRSLRVVVCVHGFQGRHLDLRLVRNQWLLIDPKAEFLMSRSNEGKTTGDFKEMGKRLAEEVASFLKAKISSASRNPYGSFRLSFVGHSIGNIIIRAALTDDAMKPYLNNLHTFMSIAGPHLGYLYSSNALFSSGFWFIKKLEGSHFMHQLTFTDDIDMANSYLYKLGQEKTFEYFQNVILVSSPQDGYVPYHSARIKMCAAAEKDTNKGPIYGTLLNNCIDQMTLPAEVDRVLLRCDVNFIPSPHYGRLDNYIGRSAHIEFLDTCVYVNFIMWSFPKLFL